MIIKKFNNFLRTKRSFHESLKLNGFKIKIDENSNYTYFSGDIVMESIDFEFDKKGGVIVFSTDVNAIDLSNSLVINKLKQLVQSVINKVMVKKKVDKVIKKHEDVFGFTIGKFVKGRYKSDDGSLYDEESISIEIIGIDSDTLLKVAEDIAEEFQQETVLVKDYQMDSIYLAKKDKNLIKDDEE